MKKQAKKATPDFQKVWNAYRKNPNDTNRNAVFELYLPQIRKLVWQFLVKSMMPASYDDVLQESCIRVLGAIQRFDPGRAKFCTFIRLQVMGACLDWLRTTDPLNRNHRAAIKAMEAMRERLMSKLGRRPNDYDMAWHFGLSERKVMECVDPGRNRECRVDLLVAKMQPNLPNDWFDDLTRGLAGRDSEILRLYYLEGLTMSQVAAALGMSESRVSQTIPFILAFLRKNRDRAEAFADIKCS